MDVKHLEYFITIVESRFNISKAAEALYISQPALTKYIKEFESAEHVQLFIRYKGRLVDLTPAGHLFYDKAKDVVKQYHKLMDQLHQPQGLIRGTVRLGIPSLVLTSSCLTIIPKFIKENPNINLKITVDGAQKLQELLLNATLPNPSGQGYQRGTIVSRPLDPKFLWTITLAKINNVYHNESINLTEQYFIKHFQSN